MRKKNAILVNATYPREANPGCFHTTLGLFALCSKYFSVDYRIPLDSLKEAPALLGHPKAPSVYVLLRFALIHPKYFIQILRSSCVVVNGEGTIHNNRKASVSLIWLIAIACKLGKKVALVNCTIEEMSPRYMNLLKPCEYLVAREEASAEFLRQYNERALAFPDASLCSDHLDKYCRASLMNLRRYPDDSNPNSSIVVTFGVLSEQPGAFSVYSSLIDKVSSCTKNIDQITYLIVHNGDRDISIPLNRMGWSIFDIYRESQLDLLKTLDRSQIVITGRYHVALFSCLMGKHVLLLPSNTGKMEQLSLTIKRINPDYPIDMINPDSLKADEIRCRVAEAISEAREKSVLRREAMLRYAESARQDYSVLFSELCTK